MLLIWKMIARSLDVFFRPADETPNTLSVLSMTANTIADNASKFNSDISTMYHVGSTACDGCSNATALIGVIYGSPLYRTSRAFGNRRDIIRYYAMSGMISSR